MVQIRRGEVGWIGRGNSRHRGETPLPAILRITYQTPVPATPSIRATISFHVRSEGCDFPSAGIGEVETRSLAERIIVPIKVRVGVQRVGATRFAPVFRQQDVDFEKPH